jgi:hypothetical protein
MVAIGEARQSPYEGGMIAAGKEIRERTYQTGTTFAICKLTLHMAASVTRIYTEDLINASLRKLNLGNQQLLAFAAEAAEAWGSGH